MDDVWTIGSLLRISGAPVAAMLALLTGSAACVQQREGAGPVVRLPPEAVRFERFLEGEGTLRADRVAVWLVRDYRRDVAPIVDEEAHVREITPDRIRLTAAGAGRPPPVRLALRNLRIAARRSIDVRFSDRPLVESPDRPLLVHIVADGLAALDCAAGRLVGERIEIENDRATAYDAKGRRVGSIAP